MKNYGRDNRPYLKPVTRIELSEKNIKQRWILAAVFLVIGIVALAVGYSTAMETPPGWQQVKAAGNQASCADDFILMYEFTGSAREASSLNTALTRLYGEETMKAYQLFSPDVAEEGLHNLHHLNAHPNEAVTVETPLYDALALAAGYGTRHLYLAPAAAQFGSLFLSENDLEASALDPTQDPVTVAWFQELAVFVNDPEHIRLEILADSQVRLLVSDAYLAFAQEYGIETLVDFGWMRNAFLADYLAQALEAHGFTQGYLTSFDGFTRNLDSRGETFYFNMFSRQGRDVYLPGRLAYEGPASIVSYRDYPMSAADRWHYYAYESGETVHVFLDPADLQGKTALPELVFYSQDRGCAEILLETCGIFIADRFRPEDTEPLKASGIYALWCEGAAIRHNGPYAIAEPPAK